MNNKLEFLKHSFESYKHLTTLSTGSIVILISFLDKIFPNPEWKFLIVICFFCLVISMFTSAIALFFLSNEMVTDNWTPENTIWTITRGSLGGFLIGILSLVIFAIKNFI